MWGENIDISAKTGPVLYKKVLLLKATATWGENINILVKTGPILYKKVLLQKATAMWGEISIFQQK